MSVDSILRSWVQSHKVCWESTPLVEQHGPERVHVGYEITLFARHTPGVRADPGCTECQDLYQKLRAIAVFTLPKEERPSRYEILPFDASFHLRPEAEWAPEVQLTIQVIHRHDYFHAVDACEKRCADEIRRNLGALGAQPHRWSERLAAPIAG